MIEKRSNILLVPNRAIHEGPEGTTVNIPIDEETGEIEEKAIVTGISDGFDTEVVTGLGEGDIVLIETRVSVSSEDSGMFFGG